MGRRRRKSVMTGKKMDGRTRVETVKGLQFDSAGNLIKPKSPPIKTKEDAVHALMQMEKDIRSERKRLAREARRR